MTDNISTPILNVYSPKEPHSSAYLVCNLTALEKLQEELTVLIGVCKDFQPEFYKHSITFFDTDGEEYSLVIIYEPSSFDAIYAPYIEDIKMNLDFLAEDYYSMRSDRFNTKKQEYLNAISKLYFNVPTNE